LIKLFYTLKMLILDILKSVSGADLYRFAPFRKSVRIFRVTQKPEKGDLVELTSETFPGREWLQTPLEPCAFGSRNMGSRSRSKSMFQGLGRQNEQMSL